MIILENEVIKMCFPFLGKYPGKFLHMYITEFIAALLEIKNWKQPIGSSAGLFYIVVQSRCGISYSRENE